MSLTLFSDFEIFEPLLKNTFTELFFESFYQDEILQITDKRVFAISLLPGYERHGTFVIISGSKRLVRTITCNNATSRGSPDNQPIKIDENRQALAIDSKLCR